MELAIIR